MVQPRIQSRAVRARPVHSRRSPRSFGGTLLGVVGALLAIPTAAAIQIAVREYLEYKREYGNPFVSPDPAIGSGPAPADSPGGAS